MAQILLLGPRGAERTRLADLIATSGHKLTESDSLDQAEGLLSSSTVGAVFCFYTFSDGTALDVIHHANGTKVVVVAEFAETARVADAMAEGAVDFLPIPIDPAEVTACLSRLLNGGAPAAQVDPVRFEAYDGILIVHFPVIMSYDASLRLNRLFSETLPVPTRGAILDLSKTEKLSSSGVGLMFMVRRSFESTDKRAVVAGASPRIRHVLRLAGGEELFLFASTIDEAVQQLPPAT